jgi:hypothetical protein
MSQEVSMRGNRRSYPRRILLIIGGVLWMLQGFLASSRERLTSRARTTESQRAPLPGDGDT